MSIGKRFHFAFSGKEVFFIVTMLFFIASLLFTLGLLLGQSEELKISDSAFATSSINDELESEDVDIEDETEVASELKQEPIKEQVPKEENSPKQLPKKENLSFYNDLTKNNKVERIGKNYSGLSESVLNANKGKYTVQVAAYSKEIDAEGKTKQLKKTCCSSAYYVINEVDGKGLWYQVRIGFFEKLKNAKNFAKRLKDRNVIVDYMIKIVR